MGGPNPQIPFISGFKLGRPAREGTAGGSLPNVYL